MHSTFNSQSACPTSDLPTPTPGTYFVQPAPRTLNGPACAAFHQQVQELAPAATADTYASSSGYLTAALLDADELLLAYADGSDPAAVLAHLAAQLPDATTQRRLADRLA